MIAGERGTPRTTGKTPVVRNDDRTKKRVRFSSLQKRQTADNDIHSDCWKGLLASNMKDLRICTKEYPQVRNE